MPVRKVKGGYKWGSRGRVYSSRAGAERQARAAYAHGYNPIPVKPIPEKTKRAVRKKLGMSY